jgi:hypothetical protein
MKRLDQFFSEEDKKKPQLLKKGEAADDKKYTALMVEYKKLRRNPDNRKEAEKVLKKALKLAKEGDVSDKCKTLTAYL